MVATNFANLQDGLQFLSLFDTAFAQCATIGLPVSVSLSGGTYTVASNAFGDILVTASAASHIQLPASSSRNGVPISIIDVAGNLATFHLTIMPNGGEFIMGQASYVLGVNYGGVTFWPLPTGGWYMK